MFRVASKRDGRGHLTPFYSTFDAGVISSPAFIPNLRIWLQKGGSGTAWPDANGLCGSGTLLGGAAWNSGAVQFNQSGTAQYVEGFSTLIALPGDKTIVIWATSTDATFARRGLIGTRGASGGFFMGYYTSNSFQCVSQSGGVFRPTITMPAVNTRNCWIVTQSGTTATIYLNGVQVAQMTSFTVDTTPTYNGKVGGEQQGDTAANWQGSIDTVLVYSRALTTAEIATVYTGTQ